MERKDSKSRIIKETFPPEILSIIGSILAGLILTLILLPFKSFPNLILIIPALLSLRGNITSPFNARTARDLIIGEFNNRNLIENILATYILAMITAVLIGICSLLLEIFFFKLGFISFEHFIFIPSLSMIFTLSTSIPISIILNYYVFKYGLNPNNVIQPFMSAIEDCINVIFFYITLIILGVQ